jgi:hypothetical protein
MKKCTTFLTIKEIKIKIMLRFYPIPVRMTTIKSGKLNKCWRSIIHCWWESKLVQPLWKTVWKHFQNYK